MLAVGIRLSCTKEFFNDWTSSLGNDRISRVFQIRPMHISYSFDKKNKGSIVGLRITVNHILSKAPSVSELTSMINDQTKTAKIELNANLGSREIEKRKQSLSDFPYTKKQEKSQDIRGLSS